MTQTSTIADLPGPDAYDKPCKPLAPAWIMSGYTHALAAPPPESAGT